MVRLLHWGHRKAFAVETLYGNRWLICVGINSREFATSITLDSVGSFAAVNLQRHGSESLWRDEAEYAHGAMHEPGSKHEREREHARF
jgi:hypothetical protein